MKGQRLSTQTAKVLFLKAHPELWDRPPNDIKAELVKAGLVSKTTYVLDLGLSKIVQRLKQQ